MDIVHWQSRWKVPSEAMPSVGRKHDFPAGEFTIIAFCDACAHSGPLDRSKVPERSSVPGLAKRLCCSACGAREASLRIVYTGAGGFHYGTPETPD